MEYINNFFSGQIMLYTCMVIALVTALGLYLGKQRLFGISLGISFVFFVGIFAGHIGVNLDPEVLDFAQAFGLAIYGYALGLQVGPSFFPSLRSGGLQLNMVSIAIMALNIIIVLGLYYGTDTPMSELVGVLAGSVTCTPALGAAQQTLAQVGSDASTITDMALAAAVAYPFGVVGTIFMIVIMRFIFRKYRGMETEPEKDDDSTPELVTLRVTNSNFSEKPLSFMVSAVSCDFNLSLIRRGGEFITPQPDTEILVGDYLLLMTTPENIRIIQPLIGAYDEVEWETGENNLITKNIIVSQPSVNGKTIGDLQIRNKYNVNVTSVRRSGMSLLASKKLYFLLGDKVTVVGNQDAIANVERLLGNSVKKLEEPNLRTIFFGLGIGLLLGAIPISIPGISAPVRLGLAGGTVLVGILMGAFGYKFKISTFTTNSANYMLRDMGILLYLACLGIQVGGSFMETILNGSGLKWLGFGALITALPVLIVGLIIIKYRKTDMPTVFGMICGSMGNPSALQYTNEITGKDSPIIAYAAVYPLTMFLRVIASQILVMIFL